jgi:hypothetical protein
LHPLLLLPATIVGFFIGRVASGSGKSAVSAALQGAPAAAWARFVAVMAVHPKEHIDKRYKLGAFGMDVRRLRDVGLLETASKGVYGDEVGVWMGKWKAPLTEAGFLGSMPLQYAAFVRSMRAAAPKVSRYVGIWVDGQRCSLSGLLGVVHAAGEAGVESWVKDANVRRRFSKTTDTWKRTNNLF